MVLQEVVPGQCKLEYGDSADMYLNRIKSAIMGNVLVVMLSVLMVLMIAGVLWVASKMLRGTLGEWIRMRRSPHAALLGPAAALSDESGGDDYAKTGDQEDAALVPEVQVVRQRVKQIKDLHRDYNLALEDHVRARGGDPGQGLVDESILSRAHDDFDYSKA